MKNFKIYEFLVLFKTKFLRNNYVNITHFLLSWLLFYIRQDKLIKIRKTPEMYEYEYKTSMCPLKYAKNLFDKLSLQFKLNVWADIKLKHHNNTFIYLIGH